MQELHAKDVDLYLHQQGLGTSTPSGRAMFQMMGVFSEFERAMIQERVKAGLARTKDDGVTLGRPTLEISERAAEVLAMRAKGVGVRKIAKTLQGGHWNGTSAFGVGSGRVRDHVISVCSSHGVSYRWRPPLAKTIVELAKPHDTAEALASKGIFKAVESVEIRVKAARNIGFQFTLGNRLISAYRFIAN